MSDVCPNYSPIARIRTPSHRLTPLLLLVSLGTSGDSAFELFGSRSPPAGVLMKSFSRAIKQSAEMLWPGRKCNVTISWSPVGSQTFPKVDGQGCQTTLYLSGSALDPLPSRRYNYSYQHPLHPFTHPCHLLDYPFPSFNHTRVCFRWPTRSAQPWHRRSQRIQTK